jgi:uncharacterized protein DUF6494
MNESDAVDQSPRRAPLLSLRDLSRVRVDPTTATSRAWRATAACHTAGHPSAISEDTMNEDVLNMEIRKFLKRVGVTSQREIETAVRAGIESGKLKGRKTVSARMTLMIDALGLEHEIAEDIAFE